jgi:predicted membrane protein
MNKINPFVLAAVLFAVLLISAYEVSLVKSDIREAGRGAAVMEAEAKKINTLKKVWDKTNIEAKLKSIFGENRVSDKGLVFEVRANSLSRQSANELIGKALSEAFEIEKFSLSAQSDESLSLTLEIIK